MSNREWLEISVKLNTDLEQRVLAIYDENVKRAAHESGKILKRRTITELEQRGHVAEKDLINSLYVEIEESESIGWIVSLTTLDIAANALEYGTKPTDDEGPVNVGNIILWLEAKGIEPDTGTVEDYAYAIAKKIGRLGMTVAGIPVKGNLKRPFNAAQKKSKREIDTVWTDAIASIVAGVNKLE